MVGLVCSYCKFEFPTSSWLILATDVANKVLDISM